MTVEAVYAGIKSRISSRFETHRAALAAEIAATIDTYKTLAIGDMLNPPTPAIELLPSSIDIIYADGQILDDGMEHHVISIRVTCAGSVTTKVTEYLMRYQEIIKRIVKEDPTFAGVFYRVRMGRTDWSIMMRAQAERTFKQEVYQDIDVTVVY